MKYWAVFDPSGDLLWTTITPWRDETLRRALRKWPKTSNVKWGHFYKRGYRCKRITVTEG